MDNPVEKLKGLRKKKVDQMDSLQADIQHMETTIRELSSQIDGIDEAIKELSEKPAPPQPSLLGKYTTVGLTAAVKDVVQTMGTPPGLFVPEIVTKLKTEGLKTTAKDLYASVYAVSLKLVKQGRIREGKKDGKRSFMKT